MRRIAVLVGLHGLIKRRCSVRATPYQSVTCVATTDHVPTSRVRVGSQVEEIHSDHHHSPSRYAPFLEAHPVTALARVEARDVG